MKPTMHAHIVPLVLFMQVENPTTLSNKRKIIPIVPYAVKGRYRSFKSLILMGAYTLFFSMPWVVWNGDNRVGQPILFDLATLRVNVFDLIIFPQNLIILVGILIIAVAVLFLTASLYGRVFCGFFCFQTLWTDAFRFIERAIQGEAQARIKLRKQEWNLNKLAKLGATHLVWLVLSFATALTFTLYFWEAPVLFHTIFSGNAPGAAYVSVTVITLTTYVAAGIAREQVCLVACPYGKFQTALQDKHTLAVTYDYKRGERDLGRTTPRSDIKIPGSREKSGYGDCISCNYCVNVCPTGVDIRKGFQIDCISCGLCVDACDTIMESMQLPIGLIDFKKEQTRDQSKSKISIITMGYGSLIAIMLGFVVYLASHQEPFVVTAQHHSQPLVTRLSNGDLRNRYIVRITNTTTETQQYAFQLSGLPEGAVTGSTQLSVPAGKIYNQVFNVALSADDAKNTKTFKLHVIQEGQGQSGGMRIFDLNFYSEMI